MKFIHRFELSNHNKSTYTFKSEDIIVRLDFILHSLRVAIYKSNDYIFPTFSISPDNKMGEEGRDKLSLEGFTLVEPIYKEDSDNFYFDIDDHYSLVIKKNNFEITYKLDNKVLFKDREYLAYNLEGEFGKGSYHYLSREDDELILGLGDKTGDINKNGRAFKLSTSDAMGFDAKESDPLYKHVPFYICKNSVGTYGVYYDTYSQGEFNFGKEINNYYTHFKSFRCDEEQLVFYIILDKDIMSVLSRFHSFIGRDYFPQRWTLDYCGSTMEYTDSENADEKLRRFVELCKEYNIKCGGFYLSSGYTSIGKWRYVFNWNKDKIPSPESLAKYYKNNGITFLANVKPCFLTTHPLYDEIASKGWFLHYKDGKPAIFPFWDGYGSYLDFTNKEVREFWTKCFKEQLVDKGYLASWNDNNEYDIKDEDVYASGFAKEIKAYLIRPLFSYLMSQASINAQRSDSRPVAVSRSTIIGSSRIVSTWTGDNKTSFDDFRYQHKMAMTMSLSSIYNFGQDIGGFAGPRPSKELFLRWIQYGIFTPRFVLHSWNNDGSSNMPWLYPELKDTVTRLFKLRESLVPYLYNEVYRSTIDHRPVIYPLNLNYPSMDIESDAYFFGDNIIALPIFDEGKNEASIDLPKNNGDWYLKDKLVKGHVTSKCEITDDPIYFIKGGSVIKYDDVYKIYPTEKGSYTSSYLIDDGVSPLTPTNHKIITFSVDVDETSIKVKHNRDTSIKIEVINPLNKKIII